MSVTKATTATIVFLGTELKVLLMPDESFRISVSQVYNAGFLATPNNATKETKAILGKDFPLLRVASDLNTNPVNTLTIPEFERLVVKLALAGHAKAIEWVEASG